MPDLTCDILIIGAGAGGLTAAVTAAHCGLEVVVIEKSPFFGGSAALSGGWVWIPCTAAAQADGIKDSLAEAEKYVRHQTGKYFRPDRVRAYLENGSEMVKFLEERTCTKFATDHTFADYFPESPGGSTGGRSLVAAPFDGRLLGDKLANLRPPLRQQTFLGMSIGSGAHLKHFLNVTKSARSAAIVARALAEYTVERIRYGRGIKLYNGNALMARLAKSAYDKGVSILLSTKAVGLVQRDGAVSGAIVENKGETFRIGARLGVILASGGFPRDLEKRELYFPKQQTVSVAPEENSGDGARMASALGATIEDQALAPAYTAVFSKFVARDGSTSLYPHFTDRAKPGIIAVDSSGRRFCNESNSYHDVAQEMMRQGIDGVSKKAFFIADHRAIRKYGLGAARPFPIPLRPFLKSSYLTKAASVRELALKIGVAENALVDEVELFNRHAGQGKDPKFQRGDSAYNAFQGDYTHKPNPCLAPLVLPPFYAVEIFAGDLGTFIGLRVGPKAEVLGSGGLPIPGLFAVGNDAAHVFSGSCLGGGVTIGPAMVFGYIAAKAAASRK